MAQCKNEAPATAFEKAASERYEYDDDNFTAPTAAPSRSLEEDEDDEQYQAATMADVDDTAAFPPQTSDVFRAGETMNEVAANNVSVAPTFPSHGALGRFDSDYGDEESQDVEEDDDDEESRILDDEDCFDDTSIIQERRVSGSDNNHGAFITQSFRPFQSRKNDDNPLNLNLSDDDPTIADTSNHSNHTAPQCRHTPSIITSSEASYIFQQLDELRTAPSGITYNQPKYLHPTNTPLIADSLPIDAIHAISSYCDGKSWMAMCHTSKQWRGVGFEVWRKVRMHAFRCAGEVLFAWARGEHADARELAALYIKNGVPIYPSPLGHAYHTLSWKMGVEIKALQPSDDEMDGNDDGGGESEDTAEEEKKDDTTDQFYLSRYNNQDEASDIFASSMLTYVEEKCVYWKKEKGIKSDDTMRTPEVLPPPLAPPMVGAAVDDGALPPRSSTIPFHTRRNSFSAPEAATAATPDKSRHSITTTATKLPKMSVRVHRHLADQHFFGAPSIDDEEGAMNEVACNLNADFFHPHWERKKCHISSHLSSKLGGGRHLHWQRQHRWSLQGGTTDTFRIDFGVSEIEAALEDVRRALANEAPLSNSTHSRNDLRRRSSFLRSDSLPSLNNNSIQDSNGPSSNWNSSPASDVHLEIYSSFSSVMGGKSDTEEQRKLTNIISQVRSRCARYQLKLEALLADFDTFGFDECLLDFWDEVFPLSKDIHFHNRHTAVPRMSSLQRFMTTPLPKAVGVMQCEIERVKTTSRAKGLGKGRFFPAYEYRLFIRDTKNDNVQNIPRFPPRKDSVLLVAKNKNGKRNARDVDNAAASKATSSKRGVNNYYLHLPQQRDVDMHYRSANEHLRHSPGSKTGLSASPATARGPIQVGRLQSNFIGTEFQIFSSPKVIIEEAGEVTKRSLRNHSPESDRSGGDQVHPAPDNDMNVPVPASQRSSRRRRGNSLVRLARRASNGLSRRSKALDEDSGDEVQSRKMLTRRFSWGSPPRHSRRAIANNSEVEGLSSIMQPVMVEEENGAITYTANLLGNRPRIMDVCIPKVLEDGTMSEEWRQVPNNNSAQDDDGDCQMLNLFKTIQQDRVVDGEDTQDNDIHLDRNSDRNHGLMVFQNRPPWWNEELGAFVLNFGGRVSVASVKNFQLCERRDQEHMMQFGRIQGRHNFTMDFQHPLTPTQAFAIAISSLQSKISFG